MEIRNSCTCDNIVSNQYECTKEMIEKDRKEYHAILNKTKKERDESFFVCDNDLGLLDVKQTESVDSH